MPGPVIKYGYKGKIYLNGGTYGSPTWNEVKNVREVKVGGEMGDSDGTTRAGGGTEQSEPVLRKLGVTGKIRSDDSDTTGYIALETAFLTRGVLDVMLMDGDKGVAGNRGYRFDAKNFTWPEDQANDGILWRDFDLRPCISANPVCQAVATAGDDSVTVVFTDLT